MGNTVIKVENIGKQYRLGQVGTGTIATDVNRWWHKVRGKEDPYLKIGEVNDRTKKGESDLVWALKDINFEVKQGEVLGIIGKNGAGKSTLLKILSRVTAPTIGDIKVKGRIASLLEVGTGFHPELSGRDNIFLNGAILGMTKDEIKSKFDEIVNFSGVERYIDTPVKRYSSGMYVRLAFAVAAHLDPEILIVDEVLAVGDSDFQKKCLGKMKDVSVQGRTVLFVSHNMPSIKVLCTKGLYLEYGTVKFEGNIEQTISKYFESTEVIEQKGIIPETYKRYNTGQAKIKTIQIVNDAGEAISEIFYNDKIKIRLKVDIYTEIKDAIIDVKIVTPDGIIITHSMNIDDDNIPYLLEKGVHQFEITLFNSFHPGSYTMNAGIHYSIGATIDYLEHIYDFEVLKIGKEKDYTLSWSHGYLKLNSIWEKV
jgi:lipopolysaccharide transport system ATP-binding protein